MSCENTARRRQLIATFDVSELSDQELAVLEGQVVAQSEPSDPVGLTNDPDDTGHPGARCATRLVEQQQSSAHARRACHAAINALVESDRESVFDLFWQFVESQGLTAEARAFFEHASEAPE